jgi:PEP-CTERM/exosortase A-associated glycosyltransferase
VKRREARRPVQRVLHVTHHIFRYPCGYRTRTAAILKWQRAQGLDVAVLTSADHEHGRLAHDVGNDTGVFRTGDYYGSTLSGWRERRLVRMLRSRLLEVIDAYQPDIIHAHSPVLVSLAALQAARKRQIPVIYEVRDLWENASVDLGKFSPRSVRYRATRALDTYVMRRCDAVVCICNAMRNELAGRVGHDRLFVVPNGVDVETLCAPGSEERQRARIRFGRAGEPILAYIGTFQPYEGLEVLVHAIPLIARAIPTIRLVIAGSGAAEASIRHHVSALGQNHRVAFLGHLPSEDVRQLYAAADLLVYPRLPTRTTALTTALKPLEALAMEKCVLASDIAPMRELFAPGESGELFRAGDAGDLANKVIALLSDAQRRDRLGRTGRALVCAQRHWSRVSEGYTQVYATAMSRHASRRRFRQLEVAL